MFCARTSHSLAQGKCAGLRARDMSSNPRLQRVERRAYETVQNLRAAPARTRGIPACGSDVGSRAAGAGLPNVASPAALELRKTPFAVREFPLASTDGKKMRENASGRVQGSETSGLKLEGARAPATASRRVSGMRRGGAYGGDAWTERRTAASFARAESGSHL